MGKKLDKNILNLQAQPGTNIKHAGTDLKHIGADLKHLGSDVAWSAWQRALTTWQVVSAPPKAIWHVVSQVLSTVPHIPEHHSIQELQFWSGLALTLGGVAGYKMAAVGVGALALTVPIVGGAIAAEAGLIAGFAAYDYLHQKNHDTSTILRCGAIAALVGGGVGGAIAAGGFAAALALTAPIVTKAALGVVAAETVMVAGFAAYDHLHQNHDTSTILELGTYAAVAGGVVGGVITAGGVGALALTAPIVGGALVGAVAAETVMVAGFAAYDYLYHE